jgi:hypothetical protein
MRAAYMPPDRAFDPNVQDPHLIVQCQGAPDVWWVQHHNGIFRSTDDMATWTEIEQAGPSTFGFAVAVDPKDPQTAWFVPAEKDEKRVPVGGRVVVTRTRDGGKTFDVLSKGLPDTFAYDLVFRHALALARPTARARDRLDDATCSRAAMAASVDVVSNHLPPVHAVDVRAKTVAVVTGAGRGLSARSPSASRAGNHVVVTDIDEGRRARPRRSSMARHRHDVHRPSSPRARSQPGRQAASAIWINNAGILAVGDAWSFRRATGCQVSNLMGVDLGLPRGRRR